MEQTMKCGKVVGSQGKHIHIRFCPICSGEDEAKKKVNLEAVKDSKIKTKKVNLEAVNDSKIKTKKVNLEAVKDSKIKTKKVSLDAVSDSVHPEAAAASSHEDRKEKLKDFRIVTTNLSDSVLPDKEIKDQDPDRKTREVIKILSRDTPESSKEANSKQEGSEISEPHSDSGDSGSGWGWILGGIASFAGVILLGRALK